VIPAYAQSWGTPGPERTAAPVPGGSSSPGCRAAAARIEHGLPRLGGQRKSSFESCFPTGMSAGSRPDLSLVAAAAISGGWSGVATDSTQLSSGSQGRASEPVQFRVECTTRSSCASADRTELFLGGVSRWARGLLPVPDGLVQLSWRPEKKTPIIRFTPVPGPATALSCRAWRASSGGGARGRPDSGCHAAATADHLRRSRERLHQLVSRAARISSAVTTAANRSHWPLVIERSRLGCLVPSWTRGAFFNAAEDALTVICAADIYLLRARSHQ